MAMLFFLVLLGAFFWGVTNVLRKHFLENAAVDLVVVATMLGAAAFALPAQFILLGTPEFKPGLWAPLAGDIILNIGIQYLGIVALKLESAALVAALQGLTPLFLVLTSWLMLKEFPTAFGLIGILITVLGLYFLNLQELKGGKGKFQAAYAPWVSLFRSKGALIALSTAILGSIALNFNKVVVLNSSAVIRTSLVFLPVALVVYGVSLTTGKWQKIDKSKFWPLFGIGLLVGLAGVLMDSGFLYGIVPYVGTLKRFQIIVTAVLAGIFLKEKYAGSRVIAAIIIVIGIVLLAF